MAQASLCVLIASAYGEATLPGSRVLHASMNVSSWPFVSFTPFHVVSGALKWYLQLIRIVRHENGLRGLAAAER
jgi:hypothetical protein